MNVHDHQLLFTPVQVGAIALSHRVVMAPLTRQRSEQPGDIPGPLVVEYYSQRATERGLIISEATTIAITGRGYLGAPGIYSDDQVVGWKKVTDAMLPGRPGSGGAGSRASRDRSTSRCPGTRSCLFMRRVAECFCNSGMSGV